MEGIADSRITKDAAQRASKCMAKGVELFGLRGGRHSLVGVGDSNALKSTTRSGLM